MSAINEAALAIKVAPACSAFGVSRAILYRQRATDASGRPPLVKGRPVPARALSEPERKEVLEVLNSAQLRRSGAPPSLCQSARWWTVSVFRRERCTASFKLRVPCVSGAISCVTPCTPDPNC